MNQSSDEPKSSRRRKARPERVRLSFFDDPSSATPLPLPSRRMWPVGILFAVFFVIFASIAVGQVASMRGHDVDTVFDLTFVLFQGFWVLGWSIGVLILFLLAVLFLFYGESARIRKGRLIHVPRLGPLKIFVEYDLAKIRNVRVENAGGPDKVRIRFDYGPGDNGLGDAMSRSEADGLIATIQPAISAENAEEQRTRSGIQVPPPAEATGIDPDAPPTHAPSPPPTLPPVWTSPSAIALIGANLVPLAGILLLGWDLGEIMTLFWAENAVIGFYNVIKLAIVGKWAAVIIAPFFIGHYGGFMAGHFLFVYYLFVRGFKPSGPEDPPYPELARLFVPLWPALAALLISHGVSFILNYLGRREYVGMTAEKQMAEPYKRIMLLHVTIIFGGGMIMLLKSPVPALVLLIALKTAMDLRAHRREHERSA